MKTEWITRHQIARLFRISYHRILDMAKNDKNFPKANEKFDEKAGKTMIFYDKKEVMIHFKKQPESQGFDNELAHNFLKGN